MSVTGADEKAEDGTRNGLIESYEYVNSTSAWTFKLQVNFFDPSSISEVITEPDYLNVTILDPAIFTDAETREPIDVDSKNLLSEGIPIARQFLQQ